MLKSPLQSQWSAFEETAVAKRRKVETEHPLLGPLELDLDFSDEIETHPFLAPQVVQSSKRNGLPCVADPCILTRRTKYETARSTQQESTGGDSKRDKWVQSHYKSRLMAHIRTIYNIEENARDKGRFSKFVGYDLGVALGVKNGNWKAVYDEFFDARRSTLERDAFHHPDIATIVYNYLRNPDKKTVRYSCSNCGARSHNIRTCDKR